jgi:hypothetical protein
MFNWEQFLDSHGIETTVRTRYVTRHHIGINCPFCGDDTGYNLGIDIRSGFWHCWREPVPGSHSGRLPYRLIEALLGCGRAVSRQIVERGESAIVVSDRSFGSDIGRMLGGPIKMSHTVTALEFPREYHRIDSPRAKRLYYPYLQGRGYTERQVDWLVERFRLCYAIKGPFVYRVIVPVYVRNKLVTWTGRAIGDDELRYRTLSHDPDNALRTGLPQAVVNIKHTLFDWDAASYGGRTLVVTEGVFDAMRVIFFGHGYGVQAIALYGKQATPEQLELLAELIPRYRRVVSLLDADTGLAGFIGFPEDFHIKQYDVPSGVKDPALLNREQFGRLFLST